MQGRVKKIKEIVRKNNFVVKDVSLKDHIGRVRGRFKMIFSRMMHHNIKLVLY